MLAKERRRAVAAAVVDEDDFVGNAEGVERRVEALEQRRESRLLVVHGNHDRNLRVLESHRRRLAAAKGG